MVRQSVIYQNILLKGWREGYQSGWCKSLIHLDSQQQILQQGRREAELTWIRRKLEERLGQIDESVIEPLRELSIEQLEALSEDFLTFCGAEYVVAWLEEQVKVGSQPWFYQDILQQVLEQLKSSEEEGLKHAALSLVVRLLRRRFGEIEPRIVAKIQELSREQLEKLGKALLDFYDESDLDTWLGYLVHK